MTKIVCLNTYAIYSVHMNVYLIISSKYMYYVIFFYLFLADAKIIIWSQKESSSDFPEKKDKACKNTTLATLSRDIEKN